ncbi:unnamed protein product [Arctia plantaginis]|uniref:Uncharacterized protein n=1 Tax=Arctia plantaginis TaxID=874455 RepID=A0A8S1AMH9_ARCPL|nr:unnamed protein product [Arctia plantaginis]
MSFVIRFGIIAVLCIAAYNAEDLIVGTSGTLAYSDNVKISSIPLSTRSKNIFYNTQDTAKIIKGLSVVDLAKSKARATVTSGGVGSTYVNIKLKSERGEGLNYLVQVYV